MRKRLIIRVPQTEYNKVNDMLESFTQSLAKKMKAIVAPQSTMKTIVTYAFRELEKEMILKNADSKERQRWGRVRLPSWLATNTGSALTTITMEMGVTGYQKMMAWIKDLYPDIYSNNKISTDDFIGALGIAYAHRIMAGNVSLEVTLPQNKS